MTHRKKCVNLQNIEQQGFFCSLPEKNHACEKKFDAKNTNLKLKYTAHGINVCEVGVNGKKCVKNNLAPVRGGYFAVCERGCKRA
ncbi:MAG: hypothetical protein L6V93_18000 [Clostridiales bacterium]|nr:MAG: hypothetical protein L6V93_18000 [Clostridiales bacterium]